jgi:sugar phosphate isomerase/epimerase
MIYLSSGGFKNLSGYDASLFLLENKISSIELSGGKHDPNYLLNLKTLLPSCSFHVHNYFPPPDEPFVFNLASIDNDISNRSFDHACKAIELAKEVGSRIYSFHAGFLVDPKVGELGKKFKQLDIVEREVALEIFINKVNELSSFAKAKDVKLLIENNVYSRENSRNFCTNPFLMTGNAETIKIMSETDQNVGLLTDLAHLKVSSVTEGFCKKQYLDSTAEYTVAYHLSENDGFADTNDPISKDAWFWSHLRRDLKYYSLEVYENDIKILKEQIGIVNNKLSN